MDRSKLRAIVSAHVPALATFLDLGGWLITVEYARLEGDVAAKVFVDVDYRRARIQVDMDGLEDDAEVVDILFHELAHVVLAPYDVHREIVAQMVPDIEDGRPNGKVESRAWHFACENAVRNLEWIWQSHLRDLYLAQFTAPPGDA